jgi:hypothetical protein
MVDTATATVEPVIDTIAFPIQSLGEPVSALTPGAIRRAIQTVVDPITTSVQLVIYAITPVIHPVFDAIAFPVEALLNAVAGICECCRGKQCTG